MVLKTRSPSQMEVRLGWERVHEMEIEGPFSRSARWRCWAANVSSWRTTAPHEVREVLPGATIWEWLQCLILTVISFTSHQPYLYWQWPFLIRFWDPFDPKIKYLAFAIPFRIAWLPSMKHRFRIARYEPSSRTLGAYIFVWAAFYGSCQLALLYEMPKACPVGRKTLRSRLRYLQIYCGPNEWLHEEQTKDLLANTELRMENMHKSIESGRISQPSQLYLLWQQWSGVIKQ